MNLPKMALWLQIAVAILTIVVLALQLRYFVRHEKQEGQL